MEWVAIDVSVDGHTNAMLVPGGMVLRTLMHDNGKTPTVAMVFVPGVSTWTGSLQGWLEAANARVTK